MLLILAISGAVAENVTIQNGENSLLFYRIIPAGTEVNSALKNNTETYLRKLLREENLSYLPPYGAESLKLNSPGLVAGYILFPGAASYPLIGTIIDPESGRVFTISRSHAVVDGSGKELSLSPWEVSSSSEPILLDNRYLDWVGFDPVVKFPKAFRPENYYLHNALRTEKKQLSGSSWEQGGAKLEQIRIVDSESTIYFYFESSTPMDQNVSYFLYGYRNQYDEEARYSLEFPIEDPVGYIFLRHNREKTPVICGDLVTGTYLMEARIKKADLPAGIDLFSDTSFLELTACRFQSGKAEEYVFTQIDPGIIPNVTTPSTPR
jgi:hypothetical protein